MKVIVDVPDWPIDTESSLTESVQCVLETAFDSMVVDGLLEDYVDFTVNEIKDDTDWKTKYLYLLADYENYKKESLKKNSSAAEIAKKNLIIDLLDTLDNFEIALKVDNTNQGLAVIYNKLKSQLSQYGLEEYEVEVGQPADDNIMNFINVTYTSVESLNGTVSSIIKKGYKLNGVIIRYADVVVYKLK